MCELQHVRGAPETRLGLSIYKDIWPCGQKETKNRMPAVYMPEKCRIKLIWNYTLHHWTMCVSVLRYCWTSYEVNATSNPKFNAEHVMCKTQVHTRMPRKCPREVGSTRSGSGGSSIQLSFFFFLFLFFAVFCSSCSTSQSHPLVATKPHLFVVPLSSGLFFCKFFSRTSICFISRVRCVGWWCIVLRGRGVACTRETMVACTRERLVGDSRMYTRASSQLHANRCAFFACKIQWKSKLVVYVLLLSAAMRGSWFKQAICAAMVATTRE